MTRIESHGPGHVHIADDVIAVIAGTAALEAEGVAGLAGHLAEDIAERFGRRHLGKGVTVKVENEAVTISTEISVKSGIKIHEVGREVQEKIKTAVETMTGLDVAEVNVGISSLTVEKTPASIPTRRNVKKTRKV